MTTTLNTLTTGQVAELLGISTQVLLRRRATLERDYGFPPPLPFGRPFRWQRDAIDKWLAGYAAAENRRTAETVRAAVIAVDRASLTARYTRAANQNGVAA